MGQVEGTVYWVDKVVSLSTDAEDHGKHSAASTGMKNNLHLLKQDVTFGPAWLA